MKFENKITEINIIKEKKYIFINDNCYIWGYVFFYLNLTAKFSFRSWTPIGATSAMKLSEFLAITCYLHKT